VVERSRNERLNRGELPRLGWAGSGASANTHMGVSYVWMVHGREQGRLLHHCVVKMRMEERERGNWDWNRLL
jgi:hypothetical protein